jgi:hypothetical protein
MPGSRLAWPTSPSPGIGRSTQSAALEHSLLAHRVTRAYQRWRDWGMHFWAASRRSWWGSGTRRLEAVHDRLRGPLHCAHARGLGWAPRRTCPRATLLAKRACTAAGSAESRGGYPDPGVSDHAGLIFVAGSRSATFSMARTSGTVTVSVSPPPSARECRTRGRDACGRRSAAVAPGRSVPAPTCRVPAGASLPGRSALSPEPPRRSPPGLGEVLGRHLALRGGVATTFSRGARARGFAKPRVQSVHCVPDHQTGVSVTQSGGLVSRRPRRRIPSQTRTPSCLAGMQPCTRLPLAGFAGAWQVSLPILAGPWSKTRLRAAPERADFWPAGLSPTSTSSPMTVMLGLP